MTVSARRSSLLFAHNVNNQGYFEPSILGVNNVIYSYEDALGCQTDYIFSIEVLDIVTPQITVVSTQVCASQSDVYQLIAEPAGGIFSRSINASGQFIPTQEGIKTITYGPSNSKDCCIETAIEIELLPKLIIR